MKTKIIKINPENPEKDKIHFAADLIKKGEIVAFPTETVYGLGADAFNEGAIRKIYRAKNRPSDNPPIVHISKKSDIKILAKDIPKIALTLINKFWPGPLTLILKKGNNIPKITTSGLKTIAVRMPKNKIALELIRQSGTPIAAPSANISKRPSGTSSQDVFNDFNSKIPLVIDGGNAEIGLESTVIDLTSKPINLLRPGKITLEQLKKIIPNITVHKVAKGEKLDNNKKAKSPGMKYQHYTPKAKVILIEGKKNKIKKLIYKLSKEYKKEGKKVGIMLLKKENKIKIARELFQKLRDFDKNSTEIILVSGIEQSGLGLAIMNRLRKAASKIIILKSN